VIVNENIRLCNVTSVPGKSKFELGALSVVYVSVVIARWSLCDNGEESSVHANRTRIVIFYISKYSL